MAVHQLLPHFSPADPSTRRALHLRRLLRRLGCAGELYATRVDRGFEALAQPASTVEPDASDWVVYHHGFGDPLASRFGALRCRRALVFAGDGPEAVYRDTPRHFELMSGRSQLVTLAHHAEISFGVSAWHTEILTRSGHRNVHPLPDFIEPPRYAPEHGDRSLLERLRARSPRVVFCGSGGPGDRIPDLLALHRELRLIEPGARLDLVLEGSGREVWPRASRAGVEVWRRPPHARRLAILHAGSVFVSMAEHALAGDALLEAMAARLPVVAFDAGNVSERLGGTGIAFDEKRFALVAELVRAVMHDTRLRESLIAGQSRRLEAYSVDRAESELGVVLKRVTAPGPTPRKRTARRRPKVAVVVARYGDVSGGAERHAREIVERLSPHWEITVLTTCARDHLSWANAFPAGATRIGPAEILRFPTWRPRSIPAFERASRDVLGRHLGFADMPLGEVASEERWLSEQGPCAPGLLDHIATAGRAYDAFVFFTYLYLPTVWGLPLVADRALLVPTAHDEPPLGLGAFEDVFQRPRALLCNTEEEAALIRARFEKPARIRVVGVGVDSPRGNSDAFRTRFGVRGPYLFHVGRLERGKNVPELLRFHRALVRRDPKAPELILAGESSMRISGPKVRALGRIDDPDKFDAIAGAQAVVVPSKLESLSLLTLEAFAQGTPVLVNGGSEVLVGQVRRSGAGAVYVDAATFVEGIATLAREGAEMRARAQAYAASHRWSDVVRVYRDEVEEIIRSARGRRPRAAG